MEGISKRAEQHKAAVEKHDGAHVLSNLENLGIGETDLIGKRTLDIGAGGGEFARWAKRRGADVVALDLSFDPKIIKRFETTGMSPIAGDATALPFPDESFDMIVSHAAIPNVAGGDSNIEGMYERRNATLREALRVLRLGGELRLAPVIRNERNEPWTGRSVAIETILNELKANPALEIHEEILAKDERSGEEGLRDIYRIIIKKTLKKGETSSFAPQEEAEPAKETAEKPQDILKRQLLTGEIAPTEFRGKLLELDQSTSDRNQALANYELLTDKEVVAFMQIQSNEIQDSYYAFLGFTEFHIGQIKVMKEGEASEALSFFQASLQHAEQAHESEEWTAYVSATVAYFEQDLDKLQQAARSQVITGNNRAIVENMIKGLRERGSINYREDYRVD